MGGGVLRGLGVPSSTRWAISLLANATEKCPYFPTAQVYKKSLRRVQAARSSGDEKEIASASVGKIVTLMSVDTERLRQVCYR